jgi:hypothetical protein
MVSLKVFRAPCIGFFGISATGLVSAHVVTVVSAPEIDPTSAVSGLTLLFGAMAVFLARKPAAPRPTT